MFSSRERNVSITKQVSTLLCNACMQRTELKRRVSFTNSSVVSKQRAELSVWIEWSRVTSYLSRHHTSCLLLFKGGGSTNSLRLIIASSYQVGGWPSASHVRDMSAKLAHMSAKLATCWRTWRKVGGHVANMSRMNPHGKIFACMVKKSARAQKKWKKSCADKSQKNRFFWKSALFSSCSKRPLNEALKNRKNRTFAEVSARSKKWSSAEEIWKKTGKKVGKKMVLFQKKMALFGFFGIFWGPSAL